MRIKYPRLFLFSCLLFFSALPISSAITPEKNPKVKTVKSSEPSPATASAPLLLPVVRDGLWGYMDRQGKIIIQPQFEAADYFSEGLATVRIGRKEGYIDATGKMIINPMYDSAEQFHDGIASVRLKDKWGYIDKTGQYIWEPTN